MFAGNSEGETEQPICREFIEGTFTSLAMN